MSTAGRPGSFIAPHFFCDLEMAFDLTLHFRGRRNEKEVFVSVLFQFYFICAVSFILTGSNRKNETYLTRDLRKLSDTFCNLYLHLEGIGVLLLYSWPYDCLHDRSHLTEA